MNQEMELPSKLSGDLLTRTINFHGQLLQKAWESERGENDLQKHNVNNLDFAVYSQRQKHLSFQDRGKRLKLHQFISKRADILFDTSLIEKAEPNRTYEPGHYASMPVFDSFLNLDKSSRSQHFCQCLKVGDVIFGSIINKGNSGLAIKILCSQGEVVRCVADLSIRALCPTSNLISAIDKKNVPRTFMVSDLVACEVLEVVPDSEKIVCGMKGVHAATHKARLGLFFSEDLPEIYKLSTEAKNDNYEAMLQKSVGFNNPDNVACLSSALGLGKHHHTNLVGLKGRFPETEYATELRQTQAAKWAFKSVADGIEHFKANRQTEAFQCLNKALSIDAANIEGLVARGALFANSGSFKKAVDDFECALKLNHSHVNARKYMGETLVAFGRSYEDQSKLEEALKCYEKCLEVVPYHEEAQNSIEFIRGKLANGAGSMTDGLLGARPQGVKDTLKQLLGQETTKEEAPTSAKKKKKEKKAKKHKRNHSSSSSSSSSSGSSSSSDSSSSTDSSSASSNDSHRKKKHKSRKGEPKEKSLSPLSKRMASMDSAAAAETADGRASHYNPSSMPYSFSADQTTLQAAQAAGIYPPPPGAKGDKESEYEQRVCKFLEQTKGDSDYEEKVRKFLDETARWKKERKAMEEKAKKKQRKKEKKARSKSKKKKREERKKKKMLKEIEEKKLRDAIRKQRRRSNMDEDEDFLYGEKPDLRLSLPDLEDLQSKLSYYVKVEKGNSKKKEKSSSVEKLVAAVQAKAKANEETKLMYLHEEEKEERLRKLGKQIEKKKMDMFEDSPPRIEPKSVPLPSSAPPAPTSSKFKMQIGASAQNSLRMKKREKSDDKETWDDGVEKRFIYVNEGMAKDSEAKKIADKKKELEDQMAKAPMMMDKLGGFRINPMNAEKKDERPTTTAQKRKLRSRVSESDSSDSEAAGKKKPRSPASSRSRSRSRSHKKYSSESPPPKKYSSSSSRSPSYHRKDRSRSKSGSYRSRSGRRYRSSESGSYRSRSRSRSRSVDYRRRSRSRSDDHHRSYHKYPGRYPRNRGTYYRPRFQTGGFKNRPGGFFPRGSFRGGPWRPRGPFIPRMRGRGRPRFFHNNYRQRDDRYRRYERDDREMSRSDDDDGSPMRKVDAAKERIDRMLGEDKRHSGPLSEGEERDDEYMERKEYDRERHRGSSSPDMERGKKEGPKDGKGKPNPW